MSVSLSRIDPGLYLKENGNSKSYVFIYQFKGKRRQLGLGSAKTTKVTAAKAKAAQYRAMMLNGVDPADVDVAKPKPAPVATPKKAVTKFVTFKDFAPKAIEKLKFLRNWKNSKNEMQWYSTVETYAYPYFGGKAIDKITSNDILKALTPIWYDKIDTADKLQSRIEQIFNQAVAEGLCRDNPARWRGCLDAHLPSKATVKKGRITNHFTAVKPEQLRELVRILRQLPDVSAKATLYGILCVGRANEFCRSEWSEIDLDRGIHNMPRQKVNTDGELFRIPLSRQAIELLNEIPRESKYVFSAYKGQPVCRDTPRLVLKRHSPWPITMHGCRSTFSDWCAENEKNVLVSEKCLMHVGGDKVFRAYQRSDLMNQRRQLLQEWADFLWGEE